MCDVCGCQLHDHHHSDSKIVEVNQSLLEANQKQAASNKTHIEKMGAIAINLISSPGSGKTTLAMAILKLVKSQGTILFDGQNLLELDEAEMVKMRGDRISMIFQQPQSSLNPVFKVADQVSEVLQIHQNMGREESWEKAVDLLRLVGIPDPEEKAHSYPHEMSGGQAQRVMIAMALALKPTLLIADEPTTALDVTIQAQILDLLMDLQQKNNMALILITHDMGVVGEIADDVVVLKDGDAVVDLVITDLNMPNISGLELTAAVRKKFTRTDLPILMITTQSDFIEEKDGDVQIDDSVLTQSGINRILHKPFTDDVFKDAVSQFIRI